MKIGLDTRLVTSARPGEECVFAPGDRPAIEFRGLRGTAADPIRITGDGVYINAEGEDEWCGLWLRDCQHVVVDGGERRIQIFGSPNVGLMAGYGSSWVEVRGIEVFDCGGAGIAMKTEAGEPQPTGFVQRGTRVVGCYVHDVDAEGLYIGSSFYEDGAPRLEDVVVEGNIVVGVGWDGMQVGSAVRDVVVRGNVVLNAGLAGVVGQECGILLNRGTDALVESNRVSNVRNGIYTHGSGGVITGNKVLVADVGLFLAGPCSAHGNALVHCTTPVALVHVQARAWNNGLWGNDFSLEEEDEMTVLEDLQVLVARMRQRAADEEQDAETLAMVVGQLPALDDRLDLLREQATEAADVIVED